jgi:hypothetical protein
LISGNSRAVFSIAAAALGKSPLFAARSDALIAT